MHCYKDASNVLYLVLKNSHGKNRPLDKNNTDSIPCRKSLNNTLTVPYTVYSANEQKCLELEAQVAYYQQEWMRS